MERKKSNLHQFPLHDCILQRIIDRAYRNPPQQYLHKLLLDQLIKLHKEQIKKKLNVNKHYVFACRNVNGEICYKEE